MSKRYEYKVLNCFNNIKRIRELGLDGWLLCGIDPKGDKYFSREIQEIVKNCDNCKFRLSEDIGICMNCNDFNKWQNEEINKVEKNCYNCVGCNVENIELFKINKLKYNVLITGNGFELCIGEYRDDADELVEFINNIIQPVELNLNKTVDVELFVVKHYSSDEYPTIKGNGFDGLEIATSRKIATKFVDFINNIIIENKNVR